MAVDEDDDIQMNINLSTGFSLPHKKPKLSKLDRLKKKKQEKAKTSALKPTALQKTSKTVEVAPVKDDGKGAKRKPIFSEDSEAVRKKAKFSAIFSNNPAIPRVESISVNPLKEAVFSSKNFSNSSLHPFMISNLEKMGITTMTAVQQASIPVILSGQDVLIKSQTGSGKTLSYAVPVVEKLQSRQPKVDRSQGPFCFIIVPTRELAIQSFQTLSNIVKPFIHIVPGCFMGGEKKKSEKARLRRGINVLVATPGRLVDHLDNTGCLKLNNVEYLVIDEADRLLDMGFAKDVERIIRTLDENCQKVRQTILLSATLTAEVEKLAGMSLENPVRLDIIKPPLSQNPGKKASSKETTEGKFATPENLKHSFVIVPSKLRLVTLAAFLLEKCQLNPSPCKIIVFLSTQDSVEFHYKLFDNCFNEDEEDHNAELFKLYGDMPQKERTKIFNEFHAARSGVLLCTDVAARGLDLPHVQWIVQYNTPGAARDYIHRVGRTARIGTKGNALLFLTPAEVEYLKTMAEYNISLDEIQMDTILKTLLTLSQKQKLDVLHKGNLPRTIQDSAAFLQAKFEENLSENVEMRSLARKAFQSFVRAYTTYPASLKHIFHVKNLHLGHVATSFALVEAPGKISELVGKYTRCMTPKKGRGMKGQGSKFGGSKIGLHSKERFAGKPVRRSSIFSKMSEFDSGLDTKDKSSFKKKTKKK